MVIKDGCCWKVEELQQSGSPYPKTDKNRTVIFDQIFIFRSALGQEKCLGQFFVIKSIDNNMTSSLYQDNINQAVEFIYTYLKQLDLDQPLDLNNIFKSTDINDYELIFRTLIVNIRQNLTINNDQKDVSY